MHRTRVLLLFGGESAEHEVSIASARNVYAALDDRIYDVSLCYISKDGHWHVVDDLNALDGPHQLLLPMLGGKHFVMQPSGKSLVPEVLLPILHGPHGEDGSVQGLALLMHIPIVGCGITGSAICMDKEVSKQLLQQAGIRVALYLVHHQHEPLPDFGQVSLQLGAPVFVKPANLGSSVGVSKVTTKAEFVKALEEAHKHDKKVLIEQMIHGREIECAVLGNEHPEASGVGEIKPGEDFYSYNDKYAATSGAQIVLPAELDEATVKQVRDLAIAAYRASQCRGLARVDFFVTDDGQIYVNELNTLPGFTNISMYPKLWQASGLRYPQLITKLIQLALQK